MNATWVPVWVALVVATASMLGPVLLARRLDHQLRRSKAEDYARQDKVAEQAANAARLLKQAQEEAANRAAEAAALLLESNERVAHTAALTDKKLDQIHVLVNSSMTASMQAELDATTRVLALLRQVVVLHTAAGRPPAGEALATIEATEHKVSELRTALSDRLSQTQIAEQQTGAMGSTRQPPG